MTTGDPIVPHFKDHFSKLAHEYARYRPSYPGELFGYLAGIAPARGSVWDCACGSGQASLALAEGFERVTATDASAEQIAAAVPHPRVTYRVAPAERSGLEAESIDLLTVAQALHWFNLDAFYAEAARVLRPGGVLAAWTYAICEIDGDDVNRLARAFYERLAPWWPPERRLVESGYRTLRFPFEELAVPSFRMRESWSLEQLLGYFRSWSAVGRYAAERGEDPVKQIESDLASIWGPPHVQRIVTWPLVLRASRKSVSPASR